MNQSELRFKENSGTCVWCTWRGLEFYWELNSCTIFITDDSYQNLFVPEDADSKLVRKEIVLFIKEAFNV